MSETINVINSLRSIRNFSTKEIKKEELESILDSALKAANASARQNYSIIVVKDEELLKQLFYGAKIGLLFCIDFTRVIDTANHLNYDYEPNNIWEFLTGYTDSILVAQTACIAAKALGIDSIFTNSIHRANIPKIYELFDLPEEYCFPVIALGLGYPKEEPTYKKGRLTKGVIHYHKHNRLSENEIREIIQLYEDFEENKLGYPKEVYTKNNVKDYFEFFYTIWTRPRNPEKLKEIYEILLRTQFFEF